MKTAYTCSQEVTSVDTKPITQASCTQLCGIGFTKVYTIGTHLNFKTGLVAMVMHNNIVRFLPVKVF